MSPALVRRVRRLTAALALILIASAAARSASAETISLGQAAGFTVLAITDNVDENLSGGSGAGQVGTNVFGKVGVGPDGKLSMSGNSHIDTLVLHDEAGTAHDATVSTSGTATIGSQSSANLDQAIADAISASNTIATHYSAGSAQSITADTTLTGTGGDNFFSASKITLDGGESLTLVGTASDFFYINVAGDFALTGGSSIDLLGVDASHVIFNFPNLGNTSDVRFTSQETVGRGTFLAPFRNISVNASLIEGALLGDGHQIEITSGADVNGDTFENGPPPVPVPMAAMGGLVLMGVVGIGRGRPRRPAGNR